MTLPNTSSEPDAGALAADTPVAAGGVGALVVRLAEEFGADPAALASVAALFVAARAQAPDIFVPAAGGLAPALAGCAASDDAAPVYAALAEWALDAESEPIERMRSDCLRFQHAMTRCALRLHAHDAERCIESLLALQRYTFVQIALLASLAARGQAEGGVVRTLPTPEYAAFMEIFRTSIEAHRQDGRQLGLLVLHVPRVEQVDRLLGLQKGEAFMLRVARRMRDGVLRKHDQLGRVSRDQFACLLPRIAGEGVAILAANKILEALQAPVPLGDRTFDADAVIGIALYPDHGADPQTLVRNGKLAAGIARGEAERVAIYEPAHGASEERSMLHETRLRLALEQGALALAFAPQLDLASGRLAGLAGVLRWADAELGEVAEARALEAAETAGLVRELTWWIYNNALRLAAGLTHAGTALPLALRVTSSALQQADFVDFVGRALRTWKVAPARLTIEIDEAALAGDLAALAEILTGLKALGVRLAIGGFGGAATSLANLAQLPLDEASIAPSFVRDMLNSPVHAKIVKSLAHLARDFGLAVTAQGVEDDATAMVLGQLGCTRVQGAYVGRALTAQEIQQCDLAAGARLSLPLAPAA